MNDSLKRFGENLQEERALKGMTQKQLAKKTGLSIAYISLLERGQRNPPLLTIAKIAKALGVGTKTEILVIGV